MLFGLSPVVGVGARRARRLVRHLSVAMASLAVVGCAVSYALSPTVEAMAAQVSSQVAVVGKEAIKGRVLSGKRGAVGTVIRVLKTVHGKRRTVATVKVDRKGRFSVPVRPGRYTVVLQHGSKSRKTVKVTVTRGHSVFVAVKVTKRSGGWAFAPVVFNY